VPDSSPSSASACPDADVAKRLEPVAALADEDEQVALVRVPLEYLLDDRA
jgi:hypothetical protein